MYMLDLLSVDVVAAHHCGDSQLQIHRHLCWSERGSSAGSSGQKAHRTPWLSVVQGKHCCSAPASGCLWLGTASFSEFCIQQALETVLPPHAWDFLPWASVQ